MEVIKLTRNDMLTEAKCAIIDKLNDGYTGYLVDLHNDVFNMEPYTPYKDIAIKKLDEMGGYSVVAEIIDYQKAQFGQVDGDFSNPCWVISMYWYIVGEDAMAEFVDAVDLANDLWDEEITEDQSKQLADAFIKVMDI